MSVNVIRRYRMMVIIQLYRIPNILPVVMWTHVDGFVSKENPKQNYS